MSILVSVIIPVYNGAKHLPALLESLCHQTYVSSEYIVVDNCSRDATSEIIHALNNQAVQRINLRVLSQTQIQSSYAARNTGIRSAKGSLLAFTDADCRPACDWLEKLVKAFDDTKIGVVAGSIGSLEGESTIERFSRDKNLLSQKYTLENNFLPYGQTANLAMRREVFEEIGLFRPYLSTGGDADICWRTALYTRWMLKYEESALVHHQHRKTVKGLVEQFYRYGCAQKYLSQLYQFPANKEISVVSARRVARWLVKDFFPGLVLRDREPYERFSEPLDVLCSLAFSAGCRAAHLSNQHATLEPWSLEGAPERGCLPSSTRAKELHPSKL